MTHLIDHNSIPVAENLTLEIIFLIHQSTWFIDLKRNILKIQNCGHFTKASSPLDISPLPKTYYLVDALKHYYVWCPLVTS